MQNDFIERIVYQIENFLDKDNGKFVLNMIALGNEKKALSDDFLEMCFIKIFHYAMNWEVNSITSFLTTFNLNEERAGQLIERYITYELTGATHMISSTFNVIDKALESSINNKIFFSEDFLLNNFIVANINSYKYGDLIEKNKMNKSSYLYRKLASSTEKPSLELPVNKI